jgi:hypothetical protein
MKGMQRVPPTKRFLMSRSHLSSHDLPSGPPPEVLDEVAAAWERAQDLLVEELELAFASEPALGRAWAELRLADGTVVEHLSASEAVAIACGDIEMAPVPALVV